jgi:D-alanyl-D-alanine carboxypeptidase
VVTRLSLNALMLTALCSACAPAAAPPRVTPRQPEPDRTASAIDAVMRAAYPAGGPGAVVIAVRDGRTIVRKAYGLANVELNVPMQAEHVFVLASLTKQFTASAILKLAEVGRLSLTDDISRYLPSYPTHGATITIEHLLTHTSGLSALSATSDLRAVATQESPLIDALGDWVKDLPPDAAPGEVWSYSNWGYSLLGAIVQQASGLSYSDYLQQHFFGPLGMAHTWYTDRRRIIPMRATGYERQGESTVNVLADRARVFHPASAGGLLSTVDDLAKWDAALTSGAALSPASRERMFTSYRLSNGSATNYGFGWDLGAYDGHRVQEHAGGTTGFQSYMVRMPDDQVFVAILSNQGSPSVPMQTTAHRVAALALGRPIAARTAVSVETSDLDRLAGTFRGGDVGTVTVGRDGPTLTATVPGLGTLPLTPSSPLDFHSSSVLWSWHFELGSDGRADRVRVRDWKLDDVALRVQPVLPAVRPIVAVDEAALDACVGEYESLNGILVRVARAGDHLVVTPFGQAGVEVVPVAPREYVTRDGAIQYTFVAGPDGGVVRFLRGTPGGRGVPARRLGR